MQRGLQPAPQQPLGAAIPDPRAILVWTPFWFDLFSFIHSLNAGPEELKRFPMGSPENVVDNPKYLCY